MRSTTLLAGVILLTFGISGPAHASGASVDPNSLQSITSEARKPPKPKPDCLDGAVYDDGKFEYGLRPVAFNDNYVMLLEAPSYPARLEKVCLAWFTVYDREVVFDLRIWKADGPDGAPGTRLDTIPILLASKLPGRAKFYNYDVSGFGIVVDGPVYIGPYWDPIQYFLVYLGMDSGPKTPRRRAFGNVGILDSHAPSSELGVASTPQYRAFGIRAKFSPLP